MKHQRQNTGVFMQTCRLLSLITMASLVSTLGTPCVVQATEIQTTPSPVTEDSRDTEKAYAGDWEQAQSPPRSYVEKQLEAYRKQLSDSEARLEQFKQEHGVFSLKEQRALLLEQRTKLDTSLKSLQTQISGLRSKILWLRSRKETIPETVPLSTLTEHYRIIDDAKKHLLTLQLQEQELLTKFLDESRPVKNIRKEIDLVRDFIRQQEATLNERVTTGKNPVYAALEEEMLLAEAELASREAQREVVKHQLSEVENALRQLDLQERTLTGLEREVAINELLYEDYVIKAGTSPPDDYRIQVGDRLVIKFFFNPELDQEVVVRRDGRIALQLIGEVTAAGLTVEELTRELIAQYTGELNNPRITVIVDSGHAMPRTDAMPQGLAGRKR